MTSLVEYQKQGSIGVITLNNPPVNALSVNKGVVQGILDALKEGDHDPHIRAFVIIGGGTQLQRRRGHQRIRQALRPGQGNAA